jgi:chemotaxis protein CheD
MRAPDDILEVFLQPGEFYFGEGKTRIRTLLGSCVAITLWHPRLHLGGMSHYVLPNRRHRKKHEPLDGRYADEVMEMFMRELRHSHTKPGEYEVKIFGGGRMFQHEGKDGKSGSHLNIPERNVQIGIRFQIHRRGSRG